MTARSVGTQGHCWIGFCGPPGRHVAGEQGHGLETRFVNGHPEGEVADHP